MTMPESNFAPDSDDLDLDALPDAAASQEWTSDDEDGDDLDNLEENPDELAIGGDADTALDHIDFEEGGKTYKVPKDLEGHLMRHADYTRKTQAAADREREVEAHFERIRNEDQALKERAEFSQSIVNDLADLRNIDAQLEQFMNVDWSRWAQQDMVASQTGMANYQILKDRREALTRALQSKEQQFRQKADERTREAQRRDQEFSAKRIDQTFKGLMEEGWTRDTIKEVADYATANGYTLKHIEQTAKAGDKVAFNLIRKAMQWDRAMEKQAAKRSQATTPAAPVTRVKNGRGTAPATSLDDRVPIDEWVRRRNKQASGRR